MRPGGGRPDGGRPDNLVSDPVTLAGLVNQAIGPETSGVQADLAIGQPTSADRDDPAIDRAILVGRAGRATENSYRTFPVVLRTGVNGRIGVRNIVTT